MHLFAVDPWWGDFFTVGGFIFGVLGFTVSVGGFWIAIRQIRDTKRAAEAARSAASLTLSESKRSYARFVGAHASRLLSELQRAVSDRDWKLATVRAHDLADLLGSLPGASGAVAQLVADLRDTGQKFADKPPDALPRFSRAKWNELLRNLHARLDALRAPFREDTDGDVSTHNSTRVVSDERPGTPRQNAGRPSQLGQEGGD